MALVVVALVWLASIASVALWSLPPWTAPACVLVAVPATLLLRGRHDALVLTLAGALALAGAANFQHWRGSEAPDLAHFISRTVVVDGTIVSEPDPGETTTSYNVRVSRVETLGYSGTTDGMVRLTVGQYDNYLPGDKVRLSGPLEPAPVFDGFNYRDYLARHGVVGTMSEPKVDLVATGSGWSTSRLVARVRLALDRGLERSLPEPEASLAGGIAFGRDGNLSEQVYGTFRDTGLAHIVAVSGSNVALVMAVVFFLFVRALGRRAALFPAALTVVAYIFVAGLSASVMRAGLMALVYLAGAYLGRQQAALAALGAAAIAMTFIQPSAALDLGFQLSLAATAGLIVFGPWVRYGLRRYVLRRGARIVPDSAVQVVALTVSATVATMPIAWLNFGRISLVGPFANVVVEPVFIVAFWLSALTAVLGAVWQPAGWFTGLAAYYPLSFMTWFARHVAALPGSAIDVPGLDGTVAFFVFAVICIVGWPAYRYLVPDDAVPPARQWPNTRSSRFTVAGAACCCLALVAVPVSLLPMRGPGELRMTVLDVGQGDAILFTTPRGRHVLVDGGPGGIQLARELGAVLPHWSRSLDAIIVTLPQDEHVGAVPYVLDRFDVASVLGTDSALVTGLAQHPHGQPVARLIHAGDHYDIDGVRFDVLAPEPGIPVASTNDGAVILRVSFGSVSFLLPSNASVKEQTALMAEGSVAAPVLVVPHHGANKTDVPFLTAVKPVLAVIPKGIAKFDTEPPPEVIKSLADTPVLRTDVDGRVTVATDGETIDFERGR